MENFGIFIGVLIAIAAGISTLGGAWKYIEALKKPYNEMKDRVIELERQNEEQKRNLHELEQRLREYIDEKDRQNDEAIHAIKGDMEALKQSIEANQRDTKLILKEIFHLSTYITTGDKEKLQELLTVNDEILNHLIDHR